MNINRDNVNANINDDDSSSDDDFAMLKRIKGVMQSTRKELENIE